MEQIRINKLKNLELKCLYVHYKDNKLEICKFNNQIFLGTLMNY